MNKKNCLNQYHWILNSFAKVVFVVALIMSLNELNLKLWGNTEFICETYTAAKTFGQLMFLWVTDNFKALYTHHMLAKVKTRIKVFIPSKLTVSIFLELPAAFFRPWGKWKRSSTISNPFNYTIEKLSPNLNWKWLIWSIMTC